jgi:plasmid stabilization system protein ParE
MSAWGDPSRMRSSRKREFAEEAEADFRSLLQYTQATWGVEQRDLYADRIMSAIQELHSHPELGSVRNDLDPAYATTEPVST